MSVARCPLYLFKLDAKVVQAYFPKNPGNFAQHFLEIWHVNLPRSSVDFHQIHMERAPHRFFFEKNVGVAKSTFSLLKSHFFLAARRALP